MKLPASLSKLQTQAGGHRRGLKILVWGPAKSGKSFFLASFPKPILAIACGEPGIEPYLDPTIKDKDGEWTSGDICFGVQGPAQFDTVLQFALANQDKIGSLVIDNHNLLWEDHMDFWEGECGGEIKGKHWRKVKGPWKKNLRLLMRTPMHIGLSAWQKDILYRKANAAPGEDAGLEIVAQNTPNIEKTVPYIFDLMFNCQNVRDHMNLPTSKHEVIFYGGRRPRSVSPKVLYTGRRWKFDAKNPPASVWKEVVEEFHEAWTNGKGAEDYIGAEGSVDPNEAKRELAEMEQAGQDGELGCIIRKISQFEGTMAAYKVLFDTEVAPAMLQMDKDHRDLIVEQHDKKKKELK